MTGLTWEFSWGALVYGLIAMCIGGAIIGTVWESSFKNIRLLTALSVVVVFVGTNALSYWATDQSEPSNIPPLSNIKSVEFAKLAGLESGRPYEVMLGSRIDGPVSTAYFSGGVFGATGRINMQTGSSINVGFHSNGSYYILQLPIATKSKHDGSGVAFKKSDRNRITINLKDRSIRQDIGNWQQVAAGSKGDCHPAIATLILVSSCPITEPTYRFVLNDRAATAFSSVVSTNFDGAVVELTPEYYARYVGSP